ncbi:MAG: TonB family protein [Elusimicrobia bacterium]|nr:TonB family protein [Elusimicrobiota bacterium]
MTPPEGATAPKAPDFSRSLAWSAAAHAALLGLALGLGPRLRDLLVPPPAEIEITSTFLGDGPARLGAPKPLVPGVPAKVNVTPEVVPLEPAPPAPPKDWVLPGPGTKVLEELEAPAPTPGGAPGGTGTAAKTGGSGEGSDEGVVGGTGHGGTPLSAFPRLLNRDEVLAALKRLYPESERAAGREADVLLMIHVGLDGAVASVDVTRPASPAFDGSARRVGLLMRFSPALGLNGRPVPVRLPQLVQFRLTD